MTVPVKLFSAVEPKQIRFREVHLEDSAPLEHRRICAKEEVVVPWEEIVRGYELDNGKYVVFDKDELKVVESLGGKTIEVSDFVPRDQIDPVFYDKPYYIGPGKGAADAYQLLLRALERTGKVGIGTFVLRTKEQLVALHPAEGVLRLETMRFHDEVVEPDEVDLPEAETSVSKREAEMGETLVESLVDEWRPEDYEDTYRERVLELIRAKAEGKAIAPPPPPPQAAPDLLGALEASIAEAKKRGGKRPKAKGGGRKREKAKA